MPLRFDSISTGSSPRRMRSIADFAARTIARVRAGIAAARQAREARALLLGMNDRELRDIGLTRFELQRFYSDGQV